MGSKIGLLLLSSSGVELMTRGVLINGIMMIEIGEATEVDGIEKTLVRATEQIVGSPTILTGTRNTLQPMKSHFVHDQNHS